MSESPRALGTLYFPRACAEYSEQVGQNLQPAGRNGETNFWYSRM